MANDDHRSLVDLMKELASQNKSVSISVHDAAAAPVAAAVPTTFAAAPCKKWGYDPVTHELVCLQY